MRVHVVKCVKFDDGMLMKERSWRWMRLEFLYFECLSFAVLSLIMTEPWLTKLGRM